ncbi:MAG: FAD-dependent oxidoreductase, partial [Myxococcota bacterium]
MERAVQHFKQQASSELMSNNNDYDVVVIGAGFGGLATALALTESGARVALCETLRYPGGCASTFTRRGCHYESGATLFSGFAPGQLFHTWMDAYDMEVTIDWLDPMVELRTAELSLPISPRRHDLIDAFTHLPGAPKEGIRSFFAHQERVADVLWELLKHPELLPPFKPVALMSHARRLGRYMPLLRWMGRPLIAVMREHGVAHFEPLRIYLNALCQITVQCGIEEAEALFALSTMDYYFRGTGHVRGGIG